MKDGFYYLVARFLRILSRLQKGIILAQQVGESNSERIESWDMQKSSIATDDRLLVKSKIICF